MYAVRLQGRSIASADKGDVGTLLAPIAACEDVSSSIRCFAMVALPQAIASILKKLAVPHT